MDTAIDCSQTLRRDMFPSLPTLLERLTSILDVDGGIGVDVEEQDTSKFYH